MSNAACVLRTCFCQRRSRLPWATENTNGAVKSFLSPAFSNQAFCRSCRHHSNPLIQGSINTNLLSFFFLSLTNVRNISTSLCQPQRKKSPTHDHTHIIIPQVPVNLGWFRSLFFFFPLSSLNKHICASQSHLLL